MTNDDTSGRTEKNLTYFLSLPYRFEVIPGEHGDYVVLYPDLPGCVTQVDHLAEVGSAAREILEGWLESAIEDGQVIPEPLPQSDYSGRFVVRIAKSLHQELAVAASAEGVSLNAYVTTILAQGPAWRRADPQLEPLAKHPRPLKARAS